MNNADRATLANLTHWPADAVADRSKGGSTLGHVGVLLVMTMLLHGLASRRLAQR